ncbi:MAG: hypothetical protein R3C44_12370 [Chloroflexota bacterium]
MGVTIPIQDYYATAQRLGNYELGERQVAAQSLAVGDRRVFQTADGPREADLDLPFRCGGSFRWRQGCRWIRRPLLRQRR